MEINTGYLGISRMKLHLNYCIVKNSRGFRQRKAQDSVSILFCSYSNTIGIAQIELTGAVMITLFNGLPICKDASLR